MLCSGLSLISLLDSRAKHGNDRGEEKNTGMTGKNKSTGMTEEELSLLSAASFMSSSASSLSYSGLTRISPLWFPWSSTLSVIAGLVFRSGLTRASKRHKAEPHDMYIGSSALQQRFVPQPLMRSSWQQLVNPFFCRHILQRDNQLLVQSVTDVGQTA